MLKKLDQLILKSFVGPFIATFFIAFFVIMMQTLWKYIDDLVGKGLDIITIGKFVWYASAGLITLAMPIAILISSIMTFGNLGESFELVAIKSAGISLMRFMRPLLFVAIILCGVTFLFANFIIPYANLKFKALYIDILYKKPTLDLKPGTFYTQIPGFAIKVGSKEKDGKTIHNILIYEQQNELQDNVIVAQKGIMQSSDNQKFIEFTLFNGYRYQEKGNIPDSATEFIRMEFDKYNKLIDLTSLQMARTSDTVFKNDIKMLSVRQLTHALDSLKIIRDSLKKQSAMMVNTQFQFKPIPDSLFKKLPPLREIPKKFNDLIADSARSMLDEHALGTINNLNFGLKTITLEEIQKDGDYNVGEIEWHRKFSLSVSCLVLFLIGAPLGSIIRKGGIGMPMVVAIVLFLVFHLLNMFGEKFSKEFLVAPAFGMWLSVMVLTPLCFFLNYKAMHDSQLFNKEFYHRLFNRIKSIAGRIKTKNATDIVS